MTTPNLIPSGTGPKVQAFPLEVGHVNLTSADNPITLVTLLHCVETGSVTLTWADGSTPSEVGCFEGDDFGLVNVASVDIESGTFHAA